MRAAIVALRTAIIDLTPPLIFRAFQKIWRQAHGIGSHTFEGHYHSLEDVPCGADAYNDDNLAEILTENRVSALSSARRPKKIIDSTGYLTLPCEASQFLGVPFTVLDFGGGAGVGLMSVLDHVPHLDLSKLSYVIVETPSMCRAIRKKFIPFLIQQFGTSSFVEVTENIPASIASPLIVNLASTIQYISAYRVVLTKLASLSPRIIIVSQTPMSEVPTYARQQLNMPGKKLATWVFNYSEFSSMMKELGYESIFVVNHDLPLTHKGEPAQSNMVTMVFRRR